MKSVLKDTAEYASGLLTTLPEGFMYHNLKHSTEVVEAATEIGVHSGLNEEELLLIQIASWFHDTGFIKEYDGHEIESIRIAEDFLKEKNLPDEYIEMVVNLIKITEPRLRASTQMEKVIKDADILNIGTSDFFVKNILLKKEKEYLTGTLMTEKAWFESTYNFILNTNFYTEYANNKYGSIRRKNIELLEEIANGKRAKPSKGSTF